MNYQKIYNQLIQKRQQILVEGYSERHHIIPKCLGGSNKSNNLVRLTAREHFIAHQLLAKIYSNNKKILYAAYMMSNRKKFHSKKYEWIKKLNKEIPLTEEMLLKRKENIISLQKIGCESARIVNTGKPRTKNIKDKISKSLTGRKHSEESKQKMKEKRKLQIMPRGAKRSEESRKRMSDSQKGKIKSIETRQKMAESAKKRHQLKKSSKDALDELISLDKLSK